MEIRPMVTLILTLKAGNVSLKGFGSPAFNDVPNVKLFVIACVSMIWEMLTLEIKNKKINKK